MVGCSGIVPVTNGLREPTNGCIMQCITRQNHSQQPVTGNQWSQNPLVFGFSELGFCTDSYTSRRPGQRHRYHRAPVRPRVPAAAGGALRFRHPGAALETACRAAFRSTAARPRGHGRYWPPWDFGSRKPDIQVRANTAGAFRREETLRNGTLPLPGCFHSPLS